MAIEFNCPYCTAAIRVPDDFSGKRGSCPKCATKLVVPIVAPQANSDPASAADHVGTTQSPNSAPADVLSALPDPTLSVSRSLRKTGRRGKSRRTVGIFISVICFFAFVGVMSLVLLTRPPELKGTLQGHLAAGMDVPTVQVPIAALGLSASEQVEAKSAFRNQPESFVSDQITCTVEVVGDSFAIHVKTGHGFSWYTVDPRTEILLANWIVENSATLDRLRVSQLADAGTSLSRDRILRASGTPVQLAAEHYRDDFGLTAHTKAFGFAVQAIAGRRRSLCAHEADDGTLYFALPNGTTEFTLRSRLQQDGQPLFPGEYRVVVGGVQTEPEPAEEPAAESTTTEGSKTSDNEDGDTPGMQDETDERQGGTL